MRENDKSYGVEELCKTFAVSRGGYYRWRKRRPGIRARHDRVLAAEIASIHGHRHTRCYGSPRMTVELRKRGFTCSVNRVARIMAKNALSPRPRAAFRPRTTVSDPASKPSPNLVAQGSEPSAPGHVYVSDITYVATGEGWLYLAVVIDLFSRMVVGWCLRDHMKAGIVSSALANGLSKVPPGGGAIFHSDRGCQYTSRALRSQLATLGIRQSMSAKGCCYDNAKSESFFASLKREAFPEGARFETRTDARKAIFDYLETFYNRTRLHSSLGQQSPMKFLENYHSQKPNLN